MSRLFCLFFKLFPFVFSNRAMEYAEEREDDEYTDKIIEELKNIACNVNHWVCSLFGVWKGKRS